jgi:hypothetical protein
MEQHRAGTFKIIENWKFERVDHYTHEVLDSEEFCNLIVNNGLERVAKLINGVSSTYFRALAIGTGVIGAVNGDSALGTEVKRATATLSYEASYKAKFVYTFTFGSGESYTITEAGIFDSATVSGSTMLARTTFTGKNVDTDIDLIVTATITVSRA